MTALLCLEIVSKQPASVCPHLTGGCLTTAPCRIMPGDVEYGQGV